MQRQTKKLKKNEPHLFRAVKKGVGNLLSTKIRSTFALSSTKTNDNMKEKKETMEVTPQERDLIEAIRNYNKSYPDGYPQLLWYAQRLFDDLIRQPYS